MKVKVWRREDLESTTITVSKLTSVEELKTMVEGELTVTAELQALFLQRREMADKHTMSYYSVEDSSKIQLVVKKPIGSGKVPAATTSQKSLRESVRGYGRR